MKGERLPRAAQGAQLEMLKDRPRNHFSAATGPHAWEEQPDLLQRECGFFWFPILLWRGRSKSNKSLKPWNMACVRSKVRKVVLSWT